MNIDAGPRQNGKTTRLILRCAALPGYNLIVCSVQREVFRIQEEAKRLKVKIPQPITFHEFIHGDFYGKHINSFLIDEVEFLLQIMAKGVPIDTITRGERNGPGTSEDRSMQTSIPSEEEEKVNLE